MSTLTTQLKNDIDRLWTEFWTGGITNPLTVIEQISFLMFSRLLDVTETTNERRAERTKKPHVGRFDGRDDPRRWKNFKQVNAAEMLRVVRDEVFPHFRKLNGGTTFSEYMADAQLMIQKPSLLVSAVNMIDRLPISDGDAKGDLYEYLLSKLTTAGINGQFRTPRHIIRFMVELLRPKPTETIGDPACGTAGFLVGAMQYLIETYTSDSGRVAGEDGQVLCTGDLLEPYREHSHSEAIMTRRSSSVSPNVPEKSPASSTDPAFDEIVHLIESARLRATRAVNVELIDLYGQIGAVISRRIENDGWGSGTVQALSAHLQRTQRGLRGFSPQNLWRMRQFFETYRDAPGLATLARELSWTANLAILGRARQPEEREFYLRLAAVNRWSARELGRQIDSALFERSVLAPPKLSSALREIHPQAAEVFKDSYTLEFLGLEDRHSEADLHRGLLRNLGRFLTELGSDFCFVGSEYPIQVGRQDFALDLLFFHRGLACLVAIELKVREFRPEDLGKLSFYLEALDRDVRKPHERPSIGLLLCATRDEEVVEYALCRTLSPALVAEYQTALPQKAVLQAKLHELYEQLALTDGTRTEDEAHSPETTGGQR